jgi:hypothetical protein
LQLLLLPAARGASEERGLSRVNASVVRYEYVPVQQSRVPSQNSKRSSSGRIGRSFPARKLS